MKKIKPEEKEISLRNKRLLIGIAAGSALAAVAAVVFFTLFATGYANNTERSVKVTVENRAAYEVYYPVSAEFPADPTGKREPVPTGQAYVLALTEQFLLYNDCSVTLDKDVPSLSVGYDIIATFIVRVADGESSSVILSSPENVTEGLAEANNIYGSPGPVINSNTANVGIIDPYEIDLISLRERYDSFAAELTQSSPGLSFSGGLIVEFVFTVYGNGGMINSITKRDLLISFMGDVYTVEAAGQEASAQSYRFPDARFPGLALSLLAILTVGCAVALMFSLKKLTRNPDPYQRAVNEILKRFGDEIVRVNADTALPSEPPAVEVNDFKELTKLSQLMQKPILCLASEFSTIFYSQCDNTLYKFEIAQAPEQTLTNT